MNNNTETTRVHIMPDKALRIQAEISSVPTLCGMI